MTEAALPNIQIALPSTGDDEWHALREPLQTGWLTQGPKVAAFERAFATRHQTAHALATTSCTTGLHLALCAMGIGPGDEVLVPAFTWIATANVVEYCGAKPVFVDIEASTYNIDPAKVRERISERTKALIAVHLFGLCADMDALKAAAPGIPILEDAACASGAGYKGRPAGSLGSAGVFSFHPRKTITTGEGGMVTTSDAALAARMGVLRNHGASESEESRHLGPRPYILPAFNVLGFNYRMTDLQGALGLVQLGKLDGFIAERQVAAARYEKELASVAWLRTPTVPVGSSHGWQAYVCAVDARLSPASRNELMERLSKAGISTRPGTHAVHELGYYQSKYGLASADFPVAADAAVNTLALPLHNKLTDADYERIISTVASLG